jgi:two-component system, chemotaxis family, sensor kinase CheA
VNTGPQKNETILILVVDDSMLLRSLVEEALEKSGFAVMTAADGLEAWELLQKEPIRLVVSDLYMPHLDGLELTRKIRSDAQLGTLPIILMSAIDKQEDQQRGILYGANAFIMKEKQDLDMLPDRIRNLLGADFI